jgi:hypothetical protein
MTRGIQAGRSFWASLPCCPWITMVEVRRILDGFMGEIPWVLLEEIQKQLWQVEKALRRFGADLILAAAQALGGTEALARYLGQRGGGGSFTLALQDDLWAIRLEATPVEPLGKLHLAPMPHGNGLDDKPLHLDPIAAEDPWLPAKLDVLCAQWEILQVLMREGGQW